MKARIRSEEWGDEKRRRYFLSLSREFIAELRWKTGDKLRLGEHPRFAGVAQVWREGARLFVDRGIAVTLRNKQGTFYIALPHAFIEYFSLETGQEVMVIIPPVDYEQDKRLSLKW